MKKVIAALAATTVAATANAGSLNLDMRFDHSNKTYNKDAGKEGTSTFTMQTGRLDYQGKLSDALSFRTRLRFNKKQEDVNKGDSLNSTVDYAYVTHKMNDSWSLTAGKYASEIGGFEGNTSGADLYLKTEAYDGSSLNTQSTAKLSDYLYISGAKLGYKMGDHSVSLMAFDAPSTSAAPTNPHKYGAGVAYMGAFMDKALTVRASYHDVAGYTNKDEKWNFVAAGIQYKAEVVTATLDYLMNTEKADANTTDKLTSIAAKVDYTGMEGVTPSLKVYSSQDKAQAGTKINGTGVSGVVEFKPNKDEPFRYHVAYNMANSKKDATGEKTKTMNEVVAGIRINADFLK